VKTSKARSLRTHIEDAQDSSTIGLLWVMAQGQGIRKRIFKREFYRRSDITIKAALQEARNMADEKKNLDPGYFDGTVPPGATVDSFEGPLDQKKLDPRPWVDGEDPTYRHARCRFPDSHGCTFEPGPQYSQNREDYA